MKRLRLRHRPLVETLEHRCLPSTGWFDAPWRGFDTGYYPNGFGPNSLAVGDLDLDGDPDAVVGNYFFGGPGLSVLRNKGDGTYGAPQIIKLPFNKSVGEVALSDVDLDGDLDALATVPDSNGQTNELRFFRNIGGGLLARRGTIFATGPGPVGLVVGDFTSDGFPDVVTANYGYIAGTNDTVSLLKHNGQTGPAAGFLGPVSITVGNQPTRVAASDLNGDGLLDLVVGRASNVFGYLTVMLNTGGGSFGTPTHYDAAPGARAYSPAVALADLDNDGDQDLMGAGLMPNGSIDNGVITIRHNAGNGTFGAAASYLLEDLVESPRHLTTADLNSDGFRDVIAATANGRATDGYNVLLSTGVAGAYAAAFRYEASQQTYATATADVDTDGDFDVLTVANSSAALTVHSNPGNGIFFVPERSPAGGNVWGLDAGDIDGDGDLDAVNSDTGLLFSPKKQVKIHQNNGDGTFGTTTYAAPIFARDVLLRDLDGDGDLDLLLGPNGNFPPYNFATALNNGDGTFQAGIMTTVNSCGEGSIDAFDLDNDGDLDVVLTEEEGCGGGAPPRVFIFRNNGAASFTLATTLFPPGFATGISGADLNHDGKIDLVTSLGSGVGVYLGDGDLTFQAPISSSMRPYRFTLTDLNNDGDLDIGMIIPQDSWGTVYIGAALGNGNGTFQPAVQYLGSSVLESAFLISHDIDAGDINRDGFLDLLVTNDASNDLSLFLGKGDGSLQPQQRYGVGYAAWLSAFADFTGDQIPDVATVIAMPPLGFTASLVLLRGEADRNVGSGDDAADRRVPAGVDLPGPLLLRSILRQNNVNTDDVTVLPSVVTPAAQTSLAPEGDNRTEMHFASSRTLLRQLDGLFTTWKIDLEAWDTNETHRAWRVLQRN